MIRQVTVNVGYSGSLNAYTLMGRRIVSDFPFSDLVHGTDTTNALTVLARANRFPPPGRRIHLVIDGDSGRPFARGFEGKRGIQFWVDRVGRFWIEPSGARIWYRVEPRAQPQDVEGALLGPVISIALQMQGLVHLHAGAVVVDGQAAGLVGPSGTGKSTLTASFHRNGHRVLADDVLPIQITGGEICVVPGLSRMKLNPDSLEAFGDQVDRYTPVLSWTDKRKVSLITPGSDLDNAPAPLTALYLLAPQEASAQAVTITPLRTAASVMELIGNLYLPSMVRGQRAARAFETLTRVTETVRVCRISYPKTYESLAALRTAICTDMRRSAVTV